MKFAAWPSAQLQRAALRRRVAVGVALALGVAVGLGWRDIIGGLVYAPRLDRLFAQLHGDAVLIEALRQQNAALADKDEAWALAQDRIWNAERLQGEGPLQRAAMASAASSHLREIVGASGGLVSHALLIDARGRIAAEPFPSYNFWQFNKPKFHYTFPSGPGARDVSWLQRSWDGSHPVCWRAETLSDPQSGAPIGVLALEVDYGAVGHFGCSETPIHSASERATNHVELPGAAQNNAR